MTFGTKKKIQIKNSIDVFNAQLNSAGKKNQCIDRSEEINNLISAAQSIE